MLSSIARSILVAGLVLAPGRLLLAQSGDASKPDQAKTEEEKAYTGCVSGKPLATGEYTFQDGVTGSKYRLTGKSMRKFAGQQVEIVLGKDKRFAVKTGLYPSPNVAAQSGALDPGQEAIARQPGGPYNGIGPDLPEFRVSRVRGVPGACQ